MVERLRYFSIAYYVQSNLFKMHLIGIMASNGLESVIVERRHGGRQLG